MGQLKVYGGLLFKKGKQVRTIIATKTKKKAAEILKMGLYEFNNFWCETGNDVEIEVATRNPETVFYTDQGHSAKSDREYLKWESGS